MAALREQTARKRRRVLAAPARAAPAFAAGPAFAAAPAFVAAPAVATAPAVAAARVASVSRAAAIGAASAALALLASCQSTQLSVKVRSPGVPDASSRVRLISMEGSVCSAGVLYNGSTDSAGDIRIHTPACGSMRLVVSRRGSRTVQRAIDTCDVHALEVVLWPAPPPTEPANACAETAQRFLLAWTHRDEGSARALWAGSKDFASVALDASHLQPWAIDLESAAVDGAACSVESRHFYENGCEQTWRLELEQLPQGWHVRNLERTEPPMISSP